MSMTNQDAETPMTDEIKKVIEDLINKFYIQSIKSVVFIDDEFPTLESLLTGKNDAVADAEATAVVGITDLEAPQFPTSTTSAVDTESGATDTANPAEDDRVFQLVESCHRKGLHVDILNDYPVDKDFWKRADLLVFDYMIGGSERKTVKSLKELPKEKGFKPIVVYTQEDVGAAAQTIYEELSNEETQNCTFYAQKSQDDAPWIAYHNLFIVFISKRTSSREKADIAKLLEKLKSALLSYSPSPMNILAWVIAADLRRHIHENIDNMLQTNEDKASALFAAIYNAGETQSREGGLLALDKILGVLFRKAASSLSDDTQTELTGLLACIGKKCEGGNFASVHELEKAFTNYEGDPYAHLNKFICNEPVHPEKVTTGTIFSTNGFTDYYVCVSPECDLARGTWKKLCCVKLTICSNGSRQLRDLNSNKYILFSVDGSVKTASVDPLKITLQDFFLWEGSPSRYYKLLPPSSSNQPECREIEIKIVAQLRPEYAHRLMARVGAWHSRIGLDFIEKPSD